MKRTRVQFIKQLFEITNTYIVMSHFFMHPGRDYTLSQVAKATNMSKSSVSGIIANLKNADFVKVVDLGVVYRIRANVNSHIFRREKIIFNLANLVRGNVVEFLINEFRNPKCIILFGSYRKGEDDEGSDIDIAVELPEGGRTGEFEFREFCEFEKAVGRKVAVRSFTRAGVDKNVFANIANGIVLYGFLEVKK